MSKKTSPVSYAALVNQRMCFVERLLVETFSEPALPELETLAFQIQRLIGCYLNEIAACHLPLLSLTDISSLESHCGDTILSPQMRELLLAEDGYFLRWERAWRQLQTGFVLACPELNAAAKTALIATSKIPAESLVVDLASCRGCFRLLCGFIEVQRQQLLEW